MGNPHPTVSKPIKIGRKHTLSLSIRQMSKAAKKAKVGQQIKKGKIASYKKEVAKYWRGESNTFPEKPRY